MRIVVIGGGGFIGRRLVGSLRRGGHDVVAAYPATGVDTLTGDGLFEALEKTDVIVDVSNSHTHEEVGARDFFFRSGTNLVAAARSRHVGHHVVLSVVGADRVPDSGYYRAKLMQEQIVRESGLPYTIVRSTQFFEFLERIASYSMVDHTVRLSPALVQPVAVDDAVEFLAQTALGRPANEVVELAGPHSFRLNRVVAHVLDTRLDDRLVVADPEARYFGALLTETALIPEGTAMIAPTSLEDWLLRTAPRAITGPGASVPHVEHP